MANKHKVKVEVEVRVILHQPKDNNKTHTGVGDPGQRPR